MLVIPAIDIIEGKVVRLRQGDYSQVTHYNTSAVDYAKSFVDAGLTRLHLVDLEGAKSGKTDNLKLIETIRNTVDIEIEVGGGIRDIGAAKHYIDAGISYIILGSVLVSDFNAAKTIITQYPNQVIAGLDTHGDYVATHGWTATSQLAISDMLTTLNPLPLESIIHTDISKDGMMQGPNITQLRTITQTSKHPIIASGGVRHIADIQTLKELETNGCKGCIIGRAVLSGQLPLSQLAEV